MKCDNHKTKKAEYNVQLAWVIYDIDEEENYINERTDSNSEPVENAHLCEKCFEKWDSGELDL